MKIRPDHDINKYISVAGNSPYPAYIIKGSEKNLMIDAGISALAPLYMKSINEILGSPENLDYLFVTHSHYDHLGSVPYIKRKIPSLITGAYKSINALMKKESVLSTMNKFGEYQKKIFKDIVGDEDVTIRKINFELDLKEGDKFDLGGITCEVYEIPGHTKDCLGFYFPEIKTLIPGEILGVPTWQDGNEIQVEFLSSYNDYIHSIEKLKKLDVELIGFAHGWVFTDEDAREYFDKTLEATIQYKKLIENFINKADGDIDQAIKLITKVEYDDKGTIFQERNAYIANLTAQVKHIAVLTEN